VPVVVGDVFALDGANAPSPNGEDWGSDKELSLLRLSDGRIVVVWQQDAPDIPETAAGVVYTRFGDRPFYSIVRENGTVAQAETIIDFARWREGGNVNPHFDHFNLGATAVGNGFAITYYDSTKFPQDDSYGNWLATVAANGAQSAIRTSSIESAFSNSVGTAGDGSVVWAYSPNEGTGLVVRGTPGVGPRISADPHITAFGTGYAIVYAEDIDPSSNTNMDVFISFRGNGVSTTPIRVSDSSLHWQDLGGTRGELAATLRDGSVVVVWQEFISGGGGRTVARIFGTDGQPARTS
jgi:hypothetical protein